MKLAYLACPYTHENAPVRESRSATATDYAARMTARMAVFSPITQGPQIAQYLRPSITQHHKFWMDQCIPILRVCTDLYVLPLNGWRESKGVQEEIEIARLLLMPIIFIQSEEIELELISEEECVARDWATEWFGRKPTKMAKVA